MQGFASSTLWRVSSLHAALDSGLTSTVAGHSTAAVVAGGLLGRLRQLQADPHDEDLLALVMACLRHGEAMTLFLELGPWVWPLTVYPVSRLYHSPRDVSDLGDADALPQLRLISAARPALKDPARAWVREAAVLAKLRPLNPLLGTLAIHGARGTLLGEINGRAAYRVVSAGTADLPPLTGALAGALQRLRRETLSLRALARSPGMDLERACRLLNALYLCGALMVTRSHPSARSQPTGWWPVAR